MEINGTIFSRFDDLAPRVDSPEIHVLAVDDSLVDRKVVERLLKIISCKVTAVDSGRKALQFLGLDKGENLVDFDGFKVDLIITDYFMPGMTGYELLKKIKGSSTFKEIPVVIMSSENVMARIESCYEEGAEDFIVKPVKLSDVRRLKNYTIRKNRTNEQEVGEIVEIKSRETLYPLYNSLLPATNESSPGPSSPPVSPRSCSSSLHLPA